MEGPKIGPNTCMPMWWSFFWLKKLQWNSYIWIRVQRNDVINKQKTNQSDGNQMEFQWNLLERKHKKENKICNRNFWVELNPIF